MDDPMDDVVEGFAFRGSDRRSWKDRNRKETRRRRYSDRRQCKHCPRKARSERWCDGYCKKCARRHGLKAPETKTSAKRKAARYRGFCKQHAQYRGFSQPIKVAVVRVRLVGKQRVPMKTMGRDWAMVATPPAKRRRWSVGTPAKVACDGTREPVTRTLNLALVAAIVSASNGR